MTELAGQAWPDVPERPLVLVPTGSVEQHGPHLPLDTDAVIAAAVAAGAAEPLGAVVAPPLVYGNSGEHQSFPGTMSIGAEALRLVVVELVRSLSTWAGRVVFVNGHGGNVPTLVSAVDQLVAEGHDVAWVPCATASSGEVDLHAGHTETSLMLHLRPDGVRLERAAAGTTAPLEEILPALMAGGVAAVSANGVLGDPTAASADHGREVLAAMVDDVVRRLARG
ncbi:mycofactocin biosynthesis peptidyl-dipeptidase MftE [Nocardioides sp. KR10-350]|uniref:mycofactocin biosynthesis peptidyl-dipeptidase MftE n=1 Tax=Nocardioides cheoyonin TaxID=3156615 RepID=UPI0032B3CD04